jgi:signal peptidase I
MNWRRSGKILGYVIIALLVGAVFLVCYFILSPNYSLKRAENDSMKPAFGKGDFFILDTSQTRDIKPGEIISFSYQDPLQPKITVTERVASLQGDTLVTSGQDGANPNSWKLTNLRIQGRFVFKIPILGSAVRLLASRPGKLLLVALTSLAVLGAGLVEILVLSRRKKGDVQEQVETS